MKKLFFILTTIFLTSALWSQVRRDTTGWTIQSNVRPGVLKTFDDKSGQVYIDTVVPTGTVTSVGFTGSSGITIGGTNPNTSTGTTTFTFDSAGAWGILGLGTAAKKATSYFEPAITGGTTAQFWRGDKTWAVAENLLYAQTTVNTLDTIANTSVSDTCFYASFSLDGTKLATGNVVHISLAGFYSTALGIAPTIRGKLKVGGATVLTTGAITTVTSVTNGGWFAEGDLTVVASGASGKFMAEGKAFFSTAATTTLSVILVNTAPSATIDLSTSQTVQCCITWGGTVGSSDTITLTQFIATMK